MSESLYPPDAQSSDYTAFAHEEDIDDVLDQDVIYVNGTAIIVQYASRLLSRYCVKPGTFMIARRGMGDWFSSFSMYGLARAGLYDGLSALECLERYTTRQQKELFDETTTLTPVQLEAAKNLWSAQLRAKT